MRTRLTIDLIETAKLLEEIQAAWRNNPGGDWSAGKTIRQLIVEEHARAYPDPAGTRGLLNSLIAQLK